MKSQPFLPVLPPERKTPIEFIGTIIIPLGAGIAAALEDDRTRFIAWIALAIGSLLVTFHRPFLAFLVRRRGRGRENSFARSIYPHFEDLVQRFGEFFGDRSDTLDHILNSDIRNVSGIKIPASVSSDRWFFRQLWEQLNRRVTQGRRDYTTLVQRLEELQAVYNAYHRQLAEPLFESLIPAISHDLDTRILSNAHDARERLARYVDDLDDFAKLVVRSSRATNAREFYFPRPKPIVERRQQTS